jgi:hypothetical protein
VILFCVATGIDHGLVGIIDHAMQSMSIRVHRAQSREWRVYAHGPDAAASAREHPTKPRTASSASKASAAREPPVNAHCWGGVTRIHACAVRVRMLSTCLRAIPTCRGG